MSLPIWSLRLSTRSGVSGSDLLRALSEVPDPRACRDVWALDVQDLGGGVVRGRPPRSASGPLTPHRGSRRLLGGVARPTFAVFWHVG